MIPVAGDLVVPDAGGTPFWGYTRIRGKNPPTKPAKSPANQGGGFLPRYGKIFENAILAPHGVPNPKKECFFGEFGFRTCQTTIQKFFSAVLR